MPNPFTQIAPFSNVTQDVMQYLGYQDQKNARANQTVMAMMDKYSQLPSRSVDAEGKIKRVQEYTQQAFDTFKKYRNNFNKALPEFSMLISKASSDPYFNKMVEAKAKEDVYDQEHQQLQMKYGARYNPTDMSYKTTPIQNADGSFNDPSYNYYVSHDWSKGAGEYFKNLKPSESTQYRTSMGEPVDPNTYTGRGWYKEKYKAVNPDEFYNMIGMRVNKEKGYLEPGGDMSGLQGYLNDNPDLIKQYRSEHPNSPIEGIYDWVGANLYAQGKKLLIPESSGKDWEWNTYQVNKEKEANKEANKTIKEKPVTVQRTIFNPPIATGPTQGRYMDITGKVKSLQEDIHSIEGKQFKSEDEKRRLGVYKRQLPEWKNSLEEVYNEASKVLNVQYKGNNVSVSVHRSSDDNTPYFNMYRNYGERGDVLLGTFKLDDMPPSLDKEYDISGTLKDFSDKIFTSIPKRANSEYLLQTKESLMDQTTGELKVDKNHSFWFDYELSNMFEKRPETFDILNPQTFETDQEYKNHSSSFSKDKPKPRSGVKIKSFGLDNDSGKWYARGNVYDVSDPKKGPQNPSEDILFDITTQVNSNELALSQKEKEEISFKSDIKEQLSFPTFKSSVIKKINKNTFPEYANLLGDNEYEVSFTKDKNSSDLPIVAVKYPGDDEWKESGRGATDVALTNIWSHIQGQELMRQESITGGIGGGKLPSTAYNVLQKHIPDSTTNPSMVEALNFIYEQEGGLQKSAYKVGKEDTSTIGVGHYGAKEGQVITEDQGWEMFGKDINTNEIPKLKNYPLNKNQFAALASFLFNVPKAQKDKLFGLLDEYKTSGDISDVINYLTQITRSSSAQVELFKRRINEIAKFTTTPTI